MRRILLLNYDESFRAVLHLTLTHFGFTVVEPRDVTEGFANYPAGGVDLVITDTVVPTKEGILVMVELRRTHPQLRILAISGATRIGENVLFASLIGASKVLAKPVSILELLGAINELLPPTVEPARTAAAACTILPGLKINAIAWPAKVIPTPSAI